MKIIFARRCFQKKKQIQYFDDKPNYDSILLLHNVCKKKENGMTQVSTCSHLCYVEK